MLSPFVSAEADLEGEYSRLDGLTTAIMVISCTFLGLSLIAISLRTYVRLSRSLFRLDDGFMIAGAAFYTVAISLTIRALVVGIGRRDKHLDAWHSSEAIKYYIIWILMYVTALATVKSSICTTIFYVTATQPRLRTAIYALLATTWASFFITFVGVLLYCRPVSATWTRQGECAPISTFVILGHVATVSTIVTDFGLVVVPAIILWDTHMKRKRKLQALGLLSFASVASIITVVRIPYINKYEDGKDIPFWAAHIILCSNVEIGVGCIASSVPSLRHLRHLLHRTDEPVCLRHSCRQKLARLRWSSFTIGSPPWRRPVEMGIRLSSMSRSHPEDDCERLQDRVSMQSDAQMDLQTFCRKWMQRVEDTHDKDADAIPDLRDVGKLIASKETPSNAS
ncbi:hypothetical protein CC77DRAFT_793325 [Alternaria alternata]|uniref:Rhodopsin domain-containing protein n=1 Tax=Alternaria alternata TaxID=5599 RepID=A0A177DTX8_ALTAL|nr:hypothetical protein CC77DRAFT_793325 [Alternaria alternata]OAG22249.1 hypothetical protein CC77DRAFT_793325 [Alternaria alternata]